MASLWPDCHQVAPCYHALVKAAIEPWCAGHPGLIECRLAHHTVTQGCARHRGCLDLHRVFTQTQRYERAE
jgi:hypothetical protein